IGSFLGVLVMRLPAGRPVIWARSRCPRCGHTLTAVELVPLVSWLAAGRRCRHCQAPIPFFYAAMELGALGLAAWAALVLPADQLGASCALGWCLLALAVIDARHFLLPDVLTLPLIPAGLVLSALDDPAMLLPHAIGAGAGFAVFVLIGALYRRLRHRDGIGLGDAKLLAAAGAWISWEGLPSAVLLACLASGAWLLLDSGKRQRITLDARIPLGPGLCLGTWLVWLYGPLF
ncbi:MAG TPA: A24 family peptidase, partial [Stellaceae bacterium]|nr:A24 family peptidase [Stellaceae bacterium]